MIRRVNKATSSLLSSSFDFARQQINAASSTAWNISHRTYFSASSQLFDMQKVPFSFGGGSMAPIGGSNMFQTMAMDFGTVSNDNDATEAVTTTTCTTDDANEAAVGFTPMKFDFMSMGDANATTALGQSSATAAVAPATRIRKPPASENGDNAAVSGQDNTSLVDADLPHQLGKYYQYDLFVIGGGSGGISAAKAAASYGVNVALADFVRPSTQGTTWGLGGTCVNVGCIPKKLMHQAAIMGENVHHASGYYGWGEEPVEEYNAKFELVHPKLPQANWERLRTNVMNHIGSLNWGYTSELGRVGVQYYNAYAKFVDAHTIQLTDGKGNVTNTVTARRILLATGGRPTLLDIPGAKEFCVTSDDIFSLPKAPGKTLFVGASYVSLECAGFVNGLGFDATVMMRSIPLRGFDTDMANRVVAAMEARGVKFVRDSQPTAIEKNAEDGRLTVHYANHAGETSTEVYDTVCMAVGRRPEVSQINLDVTGVQLHPKSGKVIVSRGDQTTTPHIYAIGDIIEGGVELTPVAIRAGKLLASRLYAKKTEVINYKNIPTTVFTPLEYGCVGYSEEDAAAFLGEVEVYHTAFTPLEWNLPHFATNECYMKLIVDPNDDERVVGFHILSPNAGEIVQGVAVAMRAKVRKCDFDETIGIHPTVAEDMTLLRVTKRSGEDPNKAGC